MKAKGVALFLSLLIHASLVGAYLFTVEVETTPVASRAQTSNISLSMFEGAVVQPVEPVSQPPEKPEPAKTVPIEKTPAKKQRVERASVKKVPVKKVSVKKEPVKRAQQPKQAERLTPKDVPRMPKAPAATVKRLDVAVQQQPPVLAKQPKGLSDADRLGIEDKYKNTVRHAILKNRIYPRQSRRKRQQGTATVAFRLQKNGAIENLRIIVSSGIERLDKAALQAVGKVQRFGSFPKELARQYWDFEIPVSFKLS